MLRTTEECLIAALILCNNTTACVGFWGICVGFFPRTYANTKVLKILGLNAANVLCRNIGVSQTVETISIPFQLMPLPAYVSDTRLFLLHVHYMGRVEDKSPLLCDGQWSCSDLSLKNVQLWAILRVTEQGHWFIAPLDLMLWIRHKQTFPSG